LKLILSSSLATCSAFVPIEPVAPNVKETALPQTALPESGQDGNNPDVIRSIGQNMALNNGAYAMSGESIKNSGVWEWIVLQRRSQNVVNSHLYFDLFQRYKHPCYSFQHRSIGENMALNNGAYAMSGESIKNSGVWDKLSNPQQNALDSKTNYSITTTFDKDGIATSVFLS
jgi:hypothetical protein